jgi:hypothetical protein
LTIGCQFSSVFFFEKNKTKENPKTIQKAKTKDKDKTKKKKKKNIPNPEW